MTDAVDQLAAEMDDDGSPSGNRIVNGTIVARTGDIVKVDIGGQTVDAYSPVTAGLPVDATVQLTVQGGTASVTAVISGPSGGVPAGAGAIWFTDTPPPGWLICNGATFSATDYPALYAALGNANVLPDMRDRFPIGASASKSVKSTGGAASITQTVNQMPSHNHNISVNNATIREGTAANPTTIAYPVVNGAVTTNTGGGAPMNILNPYFSVNFIIYAGAVAA
ncbi:phage tail protein [Paenarthrobacter nitroguajacolicus]|uniref:phage tail protein n=1 Tax=Paenarthrobacter nitroguajacolicus TaxID=211146 RepID=UPI00248C4F50|nr:tail fiber protein [Paenarthrobacter nitroguajacolicus]MDI2033004.1 hypothetical protein [Paenarthrobacter nitroguajacolicus]